MWPCVKCKLRQRKTLNHSFANPGMVLHQMGGRKPFNCAQNIAEDLIFSWIILQIQVWSCTRWGEGNQQKTIFELSTRVPDSTGFLCQIIAHVEIKPAESIQLHVFLSDSTCWVWMVVTSAGEGAALVWTGWLSEISLEWVRQSEPCCIPDPRLHDNMEGMKMFPTLHLLHLKRDEPADWDRPQGDPF